MKKSALFFAIPIFLLLMTSVHSKSLQSNSAAQLTDQEMQDQECRSLGETAAVIMEARQMGVPLSDMISSLPEARSLIMEAYKETRWSGDEMQEQAIADFRNEMEMTCYNDGLSVLVDTSKLESSPNPRRPEDHDIRIRECARLGDMASKIMAARQVGVSKNPLIEAGGGGARRLVELAYNQPLGGSQSDRAIIAEEFGAQVADDCYTSGTAPYVTYDNNSK